MQLPTSLSPDHTLEYFQAYADELVERFGLDDDDLVIAVHSGDGALLKRLLEEGIQVLGVEPDEDLAFDATSAGIETIADELTPRVAEQLKRSHGLATVVVAPLNGDSQTAADQQDYLSGAAALLTPSGVLVLDVSSHVELASLSSRLADHGLQAFAVERNSRAVRIFADRGHRQPS